MKSDIQGFEMIRRSLFELPRVRARMIVLAVAAASLGGCASGDFGRTRDFARSDDMHRWIGKEANKSSGLRASDFQLTESERQLRDYAYPFIEPPLSRPAWKSVFGEYAAIDPPWKQTPPFDRTAYGKLLIDEPHRSHASRYALLMDDVRNDMTRLEPVFQIAARVADLDAKRNASLSLVSEISPKEAADARAHGGKCADCALGADLPAPARCVLSLCAGATRHPRARSGGGRCRPPDREAGLAGRWKRRPCGGGRGPAGGRQQGIGRAGFAASGFTSLSVSFESFPGDRTIRKRLQTFPKWPREQWLPPDFCQMAMALTP